jgi:hypothetical protein
LLFFTQTKTSFSPLSHDQRERKQSLKIPDSIKADQDKMKKNQAETIEGD